MGNAREELRTHIAFHHSTGPAGDLQGQAKSTTVILFGRENLGLLLPVHNRSQDLIITDMLYI